MRCEHFILRSKNGNIALPTGPGLGITLDADFVKKHEKVIV